MTSPSRAAPLVALVALLLTATPPAEAKRAPRKSPHGEIVAFGTVTTAPEKKTHANHRDFLEFDIEIDTFERAPEGDVGGDPALPILTKKPVHIVHDLSCGGVAIELVKGDAVEVKGEYVHPPNGKDLIHFTHPADGSCGRGGGHPGGYLKKR